jgi:hypothetical protein
MISKRSLRSGSASDVQLAILMRSIRLQSIASRSFRPEFDKFFKECQECHCVWQATSQRELADARRQPAAFKSDELRPGTQALARTLSSPTKPRPHDPQEHEEFLSLDKPCLPIPLPRGLGLVLRTVDALTGERRLAGKTSPKRKRTNAARAGAWLLIFHSEGVFVERRISITAFRATPGQSTRAAGSGG